MEAEFPGHGVRPAKSYSLTFVLNRSEVNSGVDKEKVLLGQQLGNNCITCIFIDLLNKV